MTWETADKPGSVIALGRTRRDRQPFLWARGRPRALATYPQARPSRPDEARPLRGAALAYLVLLRMEVAAFHPSGFEARGLVSVALFVTSPCQGVTLHPALRSPDFPPRTEVHGGCQADSRLQFYRARRSLRGPLAGGGP